MAEVLGITRPTLYRRLSEEGITHEGTYSDISDLDDLIKEIKERFPNDGERMMICHLTRHGILLQRSRIRASIHRVDRVNTAIRKSIACVSC